MSEDQKLSEDEAVRVLAEERARRAQVATDEILAILKKHSCRLAFVETRVDGALVKAHWQAVPSK